VKVGIIGGAGTLGSSIAFYLATKNIVEEIVLLDIKENILKAHVMDMEQAMFSLGYWQGFGDAGYRCGSDGYRRTRRGASAAFLQGYGQREGSSTQPDTKS
jgi:hypothetical protein